MEGPGRTWIEICVPFPGSLPAGLTGIRLNIAYVSYHLDSIAISGFLKPQRNLETFWGMPEKKNLLADRGKMKTNVKLSLGKL